MTAYIANHEEKNRIFAKRERELRHAIKHEFPVGRIAAAAEKLRAAKLAVFKCRFTMNSIRQPHEFHAEERAARDKLLRRWLTISTEEIVAMYGAASVADSH